MNLTETKHNDNIPLNYSAALSVHNQISPVIHITNAQHVQTDDCIVILTHKLIIFITQQMKVHRQDWLDYFLICNRSYF